MQLFVKRGFHALLNSPEAKGFFFCEFICKTILDEGKER